MATIESSNFLHLVAVLFAGTENLGDPLMVDEAILRACFENRNLLTTSTFTGEAFAKDTNAPEEARNGTNAKAFADILLDFGRDEDFRDLTVQILLMLDELRDVFNSRDQRGTQSVDEGDLRNRLEKGGMPDERWEIFEKSGPWRDGVRAYAKYALNLVWPKDEDEVLKAWDDLGENRGDAWKTMARTPGAYDADNQRGSVKDDLVKTEAGGTSDEVNSAKIEQSAAGNDDTDVIVSDGHPAVVRPSAPTADAVIRIPAPSLHDRFVAELARQRAERSGREEHMRVELASTKEKSRYLVLLLEVAVRMAFALPDDNDALAELQRVQTLIRRDAAFRRRVVDNVIYEMTTPDWREAEDFFARILDGGTPLARIRMEIGAPDEAAAYLLEAIRDENLDPEILDVNLFRKREEEAEQARLEEEARMAAEAKRQAEEARLEVERQAEAERLAADQAAKKAAAEATAAAAVPPATP